MFFFHRSCYRYLLCKYILVINLMRFEMRFSLCLYVFCVCALIPIVLIECALVRWERDRFAVCVYVRVLNWPHASVAGAHVLAFKNRRGAPNQNHIEIYDIFISNENIYFDNRRLLCVRATKHIEQRGRARDTQRLRKCKRKLCKLLDCGVVRLSRYRYFCWMPFEYKYIYEIVRTQPTK